MTIVVEDGSIVSGANSYVTYAEFVAFALLRGVTVTATQPDGEVFLFNAMDDLQGRNWMGWRVSEDQELDFPRSNIWRDGYTLPSDEIPTELKNGQMLLAMAAINVTLQPVTEAQGKGAIIEERVEGAVTIKYGDSGRTLSTASVPEAEAYLSVLECNRALNVMRA